MSTYELERAAYIAAHAVLAADTTAPYLACPGARRSHAIDVVADIIKSVFEIHSERSEFADRRARPIKARFPTPPPAVQPDARNEKILPIRAESAVQMNR
jgi:hypothetical protein